MQRKVRFSSAHFYRNPLWGEEENRRIFGLCSNPHGHGHDYLLEVSVEGRVDLSSGIIVNINEIDQVVKRLVHDEFDGKFLNYEHPYFKTHIPTTENIVMYLWDQLSNVFLPSCTLARLRLHENHYLTSIKEKEQMVQLTRKYHFSSAHRLHSELLSPEENQQIFGKCNNLYGHGHNYYLEVTVKGDVDPVTGMVINLSELDELVEREVIRRFDHKHLNYDTEEFKELNPTSEMMVVVIYQLLKPHLPLLHKVGLWETEKNYFEYANSEE